MEKSNEIGEFFDLPFAKEYIRYSDIILRYGATLVKSLCLPDQKKAAKLTEDDQICLADMYNRMLRMSELSMCLADTEIKEKEKIDVSDFAEKFALKCSDASGGKVKINVTDCEKCVIMANPEYLTYVLLEYVRIVTANSKDNFPVFELSCSTNGDTVCIHIYKNGTGEKKSECRFFICDELFDAHFSEVCSLLAKKIPAEFTFSEEGIFLEFSDFRDNDKIILRNSGSQIEKDDLTAYIAMLSEFSL